MKKRAEGIDEKALLRSIYAKKNPIENTILQQEAEEVDAPHFHKETGERKKRKEPEYYKTTYLKKKELKTRQCVYISLAVHEKIQKIVRYFANQEITVGGYIDTVLCDHLETNKDEINELYRQFKEQDDTIL